MDPVKATEYAYRNGYDKGYAEGRRDAVRHGRWNSKGACSMCGAGIATDTATDYLPREEQHYCYYCGAKMDGGMSDDLS